MGVPSLGYLCRRTAIANITQLTYIPEYLPVDTIMDILRCVPSAGLLKVIQANSPHILQHDQLETLWERFCKKEFSFLLRAKIEFHKKEFGEDSHFPVIPWEEVYDTLAREEFLRLQTDTAQLASRTMQLNKEKTMKQTTLLADPRMLIKARSRAAPGARGSSARGHKTAVQRAAEETRQLAIQRKQAIAVASQPPTKVDTATKGRKAAVLRKDDRIIRPPAKTMGQKRTLENLGGKTHDKAEWRSATPASTKLFNSGSDKKSTASSASVMTTTATKATIPTSPKRPVPARTGGLFANSKPWMMKGMPPTETKKITSNGNGTVTISVTIDWDSPRNKQIFDMYTPAEKARALSKPATTTTVPTAEYRKRGSNAISSDYSTSPSNPAVSPSADEDVPRPVAPVKRRKIAPSLFMPPKVASKPRTQD